MPFNRKLELSCLHTKITLAFFAHVIITTHATYGQHIQRPSTRSPDAQACLAISFVPHGSNPQQVHLNNVFRPHPVRRSKSGVNQNPRRRNRGNYKQPRLKVVSSRYTNSWWKSRQHQIKQHPNVTKCRLRYPCGNPMQIPWAGLAGTITNANMARPVHTFNRKPL